MSSDDTVKQVLAMGFRSGSPGKLPLNCQSTPHHYDKILEAISTQGEKVLLGSQVSWHTVPHGESVVEKSCSFTVAREQRDSRAGVPILLPYVSSIIQLPSTGSHNHRANLKYVRLLDNFKPQQK